jgi:RNA polymerase sigma-70 factor, ECF subfamily
MPGRWKPPLESIKKDVSINRNRCIQSNSLIKFFFERCVSFVTAGLMVPENLQSVLKTTLTEPGPIHDFELVQKAQQDPAQFVVLYEKYFKRIFVFIHHRVNDKAITADLTSQVFLNALVNIQKYKHQGVPFSAWLFRIAINECFSFFLKTKRLRFVSIDDNSLDGLHEELTANTHREDLLQRLPEILTGLKEEEVQLVELRFFEQRPFKEVGEILGITETHAKTKTYRLLEKMRGLFVKVNNKA